MISGVTVVTSIFAGYERAKSPPPGAARCIMLTDVEDDDRWEMIKRPNNGLSRFRQFFTAKLVPHALLGKAGEGDVVWIDASFEPREGAPPLQDLVDLVPSGGVGIHRHHFPGCSCRTGTRGADCTADYWEQAGFTKRPGYEDSDRGLYVLEQREHYKAEGCPLKSGCWASGIIVWRGAQVGFGDRWFSETMTWTASDQVSLPYVVWKTGQKITDLPGSNYESPWFAYVNHGADGRTTR